MRTSSIPMALLITTLLVGACGTSRQSGVCARATPEATAEGDADALVAEAEAAWEQRADEARLREAIRKWDQALAIEPARAELRVRLARARYFLADGHLRFRKGARDDMLRQFGEATDQAERALAQQYPEFRSKFCSRQPFRAALQQLDEDAVPAMYWYATALGKYALATSVVEVLNQKDRIEAMMRLVRELDPDYYYWGADRYFGAFYTKIPFPNGDLDRSAKHFERSLANAPAYLATRVLYAEMNAIKAGKRDLFERMLTEALDFDLSEAPEILPENEVEQRKARALLEEIDIYFPEG